MNCLEQDTCTTVHVYAAATTRDHSARCNVASINTFKPRKLEQDNNSSLTLSYFRNRPWSDSAAPIPGIIDRRCISDHKLRLGRSELRSTRPHLQAVTASPMHATAPAKRSTGMEQHRGRFRFHHVRVALDSSSIGIYLLS